MNEWLKKENYEDESVDGLNEWKSWTAMRCEMSIFGLWEPGRKTRPNE